MRIHFSENATHKALFPLWGFHHVFAISSRRVLSIILRKFQQATASRRHDHSSSSDTSRYLLDPHSLSATYFRRALMLVTARLKYVADSEWGSRRYLDVSLLDE